MNRKDNTPRPPSVTGSQPGRPVERPASDPPIEGPTEVASESIRPGEWGSSSVQVVDTRIGETLAGRYRLDKLVGKGGMGRVYKATQLPLNRAVAVKILNPEFQRKDPQFVRRFFLEAATAARLTHPNTITVFDYGESESGELFIAMEFLNGRPLSRVLASDGPFSTDRTLHVAMQICRALREAHNKGMIHRDLKPGNILLMEEGDDADFVKVLDFGLVKVLNASDLLPFDEDPVTPSPDEGDLTKAGMFLGSPKYMSPEQIQGVGLDPRTDIYSLGVLMYQMATGRAPFTGSTSVEVIYKHVNDPPPALVVNGREVPPELQAIILRCLAKQREQRYASMGALLVHLKDARRLLVPSVEELESEVDIDLSDLTNSILTNSLEGRARRTATGSVPISVPMSMPSRSPTAAEMMFVEPAVADRSSELLQVSPPSPGWVRVAPWLAGILFIGVVMGAVGLAWLGALRPPPPALIEPEIVEPPPRTAVEPEPALLRPVSKKTAAVHLSSDPLGAEVFEFGVSLGRTPLIHRVPFPDEVPAREFMFRRAGYSPSVQQVVVDSAFVRINVQLTPKARRAKPRRATPPPSPQQEPPGGYKENPY